MSSVGNSRIFMCWSDAESFINSDPEVLVVTFWGCFSHGAIREASGTTLGVSGTGNLKENKRFYGFTDFRGKPEKRGRGSRASMNQVTAGSRMSIRRPAAGGGGSGYVSGDPGSVTRSVLQLTPYSMRPGPWKIQLRRRNPPGLVCSIEARPL